LWDSRSSVPRTILDTREVSGIVGGDGAGLDQILADQVQNSQREHVVTVRAKAREFVDVREQIAKYISVTLEKKPPSKMGMCIYY